MVSIIALSRIYSELLRLICLSKFANANVANSSGVWVTSVKHFIAIKVNACHATHFLYNHRLSPPRLLIAVSLSLLPQRRGGSRGYHASRRSARITADYADKIARCISRARKRSHVYIWCFKIHAWHFRSKFLANFYKDFVRRLCVEN